MITVFTLKDWLFIGLVSAVAAGFAVYGLARLAGWGYRKAVGLLTDAKGTE